MPMVVLPRRRGPCGDGHGGAPGRTAAEAMVTEVKLGDASTTVGQVRRLFDDEHVQAAIIVDGGILSAVVDRGDVDDGLVDGSDDAIDDGVPAVRIGAVHGRVIGADADLEQATQLMIASSRRRLAVVAGDGTFLGLLCLKRTLDGFCSDHNVRARRQTPIRADQDGPTGSVDPVSPARG